jgi:hypothetical protein
MTEQLTFTLSAASVGFVSAIFFCIGNAFNSVRKITLQSTPYWDFSEPVARALASQRAQNVIGGLLLLVSFTLQILAALASPATPSPLPQCFYSWQILVFTVLATTALVSWLTCAALDRSTINKVLLYHNEKLTKQKA